MDKSRKCIKRQQLLGTAATVNTAVPRVVRPTPGPLTGKSVAFKNAAKLYERIYNKRNTK